ncbi:cytochrome P450 [Suillus clintonianus]|uniref:cytochrome P450 n=1 Tax=Suillus clintonianus TaxID=1904413 RepID=UPI001B86D09B|nr:cytochrome P450 [Suillus clintonianus]KAG2124791.1 cytochrome P450 [Suillus clintonianus]
MLDVTGGFVALLAAITIGYVFTHHFAKPRLPPGVQLPPGPTSLPVLGNALAIDVSAPWVTYTAWGSQYGDMVLTRLFGHDNIVVNSEEIARDLLERRSQNYSDRPEIVSNELFGLDYNTALMRYSNRWRLQRKIFHQSFRQDVAHNFRPMHVAKTHELLLNLLENPLDFAKHLEVYSGSVIMSAVYSYDAARRDDHMLERITKGLHFMRKEMTPGITMVFSAFPSLLRLPSWLPGMHVKRVAPFAKELVLDILETPFAHTERGMATGSVSSCMVSEQLLALDENDVDAAWQKKAIKESAGTAFGGEYISFNTATVLMNFILAMILYPHIQERAHDLIEIVVGSNRFPTFEDRASLPYVDAILRECMRWRPVFPFAIMHAAVESDVYKGATITPNVWAMCHNEEKYRNASEFNPDRFLNPDGTLTDDTVSIVWGFGRRICPGQYLAEASLWSSMACLLAVFKFLKAKDETGAEIELKPQWSGSLTVRPLPFSCSITPRNEEMDITTLQRLIGASV